MAPESGQALETVGRVGSLLFGSDIPQFAGDSLTLPQNTQSNGSNAGLPASYYQLGSGAVPVAQLPIELALNASSTGGQAASDISPMGGSSASDSDLQLLQGQKLAASTLVASDSPDYTSQQLTERGLASGQAPVGKETLDDAASIGRAVATDDGSKIVSAERAAQDGLDALRRAVSGDDGNVVSKRTLTSQDAPGKGEVSQLGVDTVRGKLRALQAGENPISRAEFLETMTAASARAVDAVASTPSNNAASAPASIAAAGLAAPAANSTLPSGVQQAANGDLALYHSPAEPEFADEFTAHVRTMVKEGAQEARLQLHPAELGRLHVTIATDGDQARVQFLAESPAAREMIEQNLPRLREMLQEQGLQLAESDVGTRGESEFADQSGGRHASTEESLSEADLMASSMLASLTADNPTSRIDIHV